MLCRCILDLDHVVRSFKTKKYMFMFSMDCFKRSFWRKTWFLLQQLQLLPVNLSLNQLNDRLVRFEILHSDASNHTRWRDKLQENPVFHGRIYGFRLRFSLKSTHWNHRFSHETRKIPQERKRFLRLRGAVLRLQRRLRRWREREEESAEIGDQLVDSRNP